MAGDGQGLVVNRLFALLLPVLLVLPLAQCARKNQPAPTLKEKAQKAVKKKIMDNLPRLTVEEPLLREYQDNQKRWELKGERIESQPDDKTVLFKRVDVSFFDGDTPTLRIKAPKAAYATDSRVLALTGGVRAEFLEAHTTITAPYLRYLPKTRQVRCDQPVKVNGPAGFLSASHLVADVRKRQVSLTGGIQMELDLGRPQKARSPRP